MIGLGSLLAGCGEDAEPAEPTASPSSSTTASESASEVGQRGVGLRVGQRDAERERGPRGQTIDITFDGDTVTPNGERVDATVGEPITLVVTADAPGEIHVHSTPEQELAYDAGTTELSLTIDQPGLVDVESHDLDVVIVQLEVR